MLNSLVKKYLFEEKDEEPTGTAEIGGIVFYCIRRNLSEEQMANNLARINYIYGVHATLCDTFSMPEVSICVSDHINFSYPVNGSEVNHISSPRLCRDKLNAATDNEVRMVLTALFIYREHWNRKTQLYKTFGE